MILAPHAIIGIAISRVVTTSPVVAFFVALLSHFFADMVPHWEYKISESIHPDTSKEIIINKEFLTDVLKIGTDIVFGVLISFWLFYDNNPYFIIMSRMGGIFPDFLQFLYGKIKIKPLIIFKGFHDSFHAQRLQGKTVLGIAYQLLTTTFFVLSSYWLLPL